MLGICWHCLPFYGLHVLWFDSDSNLKTHKHLVVWVQGTRIAFHYMWCLVWGDVLWKEKLSLTGLQHEAMKESCMGFILKLRAAVRWVTIFSFVSLPPSCGLLQNWFVMFGVMYLQGVMYVHLNIVVHKVGYNLPLLHVLLCLSWVGMWQRSHANFKLFRKVNMCHELGHQCFL